ncbi:DNA polymerase III subunit alpha [Geminicoccaceae bacterium 1502E]|nr:DNA polymerase III subunit alpha [Geminicoccaceae bacterium 1502E]
MPHAGFVHLRVRSAFSLLEGAVRHGELVKRCRAERMPAVAVTDHANLFGAMQFSAAASKAGVQPILGALIPLMPLSAAQPQPVIRSAPARQPTPELMPLLVKDEGGYRNLMKLMSRAYLDKEDALAETHVTLADLEAHHEGLICLTGGPQGPVGGAIGRGDRAGAAALLLQLQAIFGDRLYVELMRHGREIEQLVEEPLLEMAYEHGIPLVATNDVHFMDADFYEAHDALLCIASSSQVIQDDRPRLTVEHRFKTEAEMRELFADLPEAVDNTVVVAQRCAYQAPSRDPILPTFAADEEAEMRRQAREGLEERLVQAVFQPAMSEAEREAGAVPYRERLAYELDIIAQMKFPGYFLIVSDFIKWAKGNGIPVGPGRGSGAGSVAAWALKITDLDPLRFGLLFERFLNPERVSMPDFDIDFCEERRDEVIAYVRDRYGADRVAQIITFGTLQARAALRDVGRVLGLPFPVVDRICKLVPANPANPVTLAQALDMEPRLRLAMREDAGIGRMVDIAMKLEGLPRHASTHAAGVVIGDRPLDELVPMYRDPRALMPATQFNMKDVEKAGLVKFDFLGLSTLTLLTHAEKVANERGAAVRLDTLPLDDRGSYELLAHAETTGVFQLESGGMRDALRKLKPDVFEDIIAMVSLYRPGPMENIPRYINVKHKTEEAEYLHPLLEPILAETNGVIIYQEQVMEIAKQLAGYTLGGADLLRRAMGKKIKAEMDAQRDIFVKGAMERGIGEDLANEIFDAVAKFASYGFNKSHAAAYALVAYQTAYLKANHAVEFYAAAMTTEMASQEKVAGFRQEMAGRGIACFPPDVNRSMVRFAVEDAPGGPGVRFALAGIKGVGEQAMQLLVEERQANGPFGDIYDLLERVGTKVLNRRILEALIRAGALDGLDGNRRRQIEAIDQAMRYAQACAAAADSSQESLFAGGDLRPPKPALPETDDWPSLERLQNEFDAIGFYMSAHPLDGYAAALARMGVVQAGSLHAHLAAGERSRVTLAGVVVAKQERATERSRFAFVTLSDPTGVFEITLFSEILSATRDLLESHQPLLVEADARLDSDVVKIITNRIEPLSDRLDKERHGVVEIAVDGPAAALRMRPLLTGASGGSRVRLAVRHPSAAEEMVVALPEEYLLAYGRRADLERLPGVREIREVRPH